MRRATLEQFSNRARRCKRELRTWNLASFEYVLFECQELLHDMQLRGVVRRRRNHASELLVQVIGSANHLCCLRVLVDDVLESTQRSACSGVRRRRGARCNDVMCGLAASIQCRRGCHCERAHEWDRRQREQRASSSSAPPRRKLV